MLDQEMMAFGQIPNHAFQLAALMGLEEFTSHKLIHFKGQKPVHIAGFCPNAKRTDKDAVQLHFCQHCLDKYKHQMRIQGDHRGTVPIAGQSSSSSSN